MMGLFIEYKGYRIKFDESDEKWSCWELGILNKPKLSAVKRAINKIAKDELSEFAVPCVTKERSYSSEIYPATIINVKTDFRKGDGKTFSRNKEDALPVVYYTYTEKGKNRPTRQSCTINSLMKNTPEALEAIKHAQSMDQAAKDADRIARQAWSDVPRMTMDDIEPLLKHFRSTNKPKDT